MAERETADPEDGRPAEQLSVVATDADGVRVVTATGEIDHHSGDVLRRALDAAGTPDLRVVLDLHQVTFIDSSGINILILAHNTLTGGGGWLRLAAPTEAVLRTLGIVGVDTVIDCRADVEQALRD